MFRLSPSPDIISFWRISNRNHHGVFMWCNIRLFRPGIFFWGRWLNKHEYCIYLMLISWSIMFAEIQHNLYRNLLLNGPHFEKYQTYVYIFFGWIINRYCRRFRWELFSVGFGPRFHGLSLGGGASCKQNILTSISAHKITHATWNIKLDHGELCRNLKSTRQTQK